MKPRLPFALVSAIVILGIVLISFVLWRGSHGQHVFRSETAGTGAQQATSAPAWNTTHQPEAAPAKTSTKPLDAATLDDLYRSTEELPAGERAFLRLKALHLCGDFLPRGDSDQRSDPSSVAYRAFRASFCTKGDHDMGKELAAMELLGADDPVRRIYASTEALSNAASDSAIRRQAGLTLAGLSRTDSISALAAVESMQAAGVISEDVLRIANDLGIKPDHATATSAQLLAAQLRTCQRDGGCGPNQLLTMDACLQLAACRMNAPAADVWNRGYSADIHRLARAINAARFGSD